MQITPKWLKDKRKEAGMTQEEFGHSLNVSRFAVSGWEKGHHAIPDDIVTRIVSAGIRPAVVDPGTPIGFKNHPECFIEQGKDVYFSMAHPRWYQDSPLSRLVPDSIRYTPTLVSELATYIAPSMEKVVDLFLQHWPTAERLAQFRNDGWMYEFHCRDFLKRHGRPDLLPLIPHDATNDIGKPQQPEVAGQVNPALEAAFASAFSLTPTPKD